ncbi:hypothetical protein GEMRC1_006887 [Eukaryota sp. GEM-RC1]
MAKRGSTAARKPATRSSKSQPPKGSELDPLPSPSPSVPVSVPSKSPLPPSIPPDLLQCICCFDLMTNPCSLPCGHSYCLVCIKNWLKNKSSCPNCREKVTPAVSKSLRPNILLKDIIELIRPTSSSTKPPKRLPQPPENEDLVNSTKPLPCPQYFPLYNSKKNYLEV